MGKGGVDGGWGGQHVSRMAEGWQVAHVWHVSSQGRCTEGRGLVVHGLGQLVKVISASPAFLGLVGHLAVACLNAFLLHGQRPVHLRSGHEQRLNVSAETLATFSACNVTIFCVGTLRCY